MVIDYDSSLFVKFNAGCFEVQTLGVRSPTNRNENNISFELSTKSDSRHK